MSKKLSLKTYQERGRSIYPGGEVSYTGMRYDKGILVLEAMCRFHHTFDQYAANQPKGRGCPVCSSVKQPKHTLESFAKVAEQVHGPGFQYLALEAKGTNMSVSYLCPEGHSCRQVLHDHLKGKGCRTCASQRRERTLEDWVTLFQQKHGSTYAYLAIAPRLHACGAKAVNVEAICPTHGRITLDAKTHAQGAECRQCARDRVGALNKLSSEEFYNRATAKHEGRYSYTGDYTDSMQKMTVVCPDHGEFQQRAAGHAYEGQGCPKCFGRITAPNLEIQAFLESLQLQPLLEQNIPGTRKAMDLFIPEKQLGIEYHGNIWHSMAWQRSINSHKTRLDEARSAGIRLIQLFSDEWTYRRKACELLLARAAGAPEEAVNARACSVVEVAHKSASAFFNLWHVQGATTPSNAYLGLELDGELVAVMGFCFNTSKRVEKASSSRAELTRFATSKNVRGGFSKLLKNWIRSHPGVREMVSYSDNRLFLGRMYEACGFTREGEVRVDYTYLDQRTDKRMHKSNFQKSKLKKLMGEAYDQAKTELELTQQLKLYRVYDCGKIRWVMRIPGDTSSPPK